MSFSGYDNVGYEDIPMHNMGDNNDEETPLDNNDEETPLLRVVDDGDPLRIRPVETSEAAAPGSELSNLQRGNLLGAVKQFLENTGYEIEGDIALNLDRFRLGKSKRGAQVLEFNTNSEINGDESWINLTNKLKGINKK